jgi:hypothetical protein
VWIVARRSTFNEDVLDRSGGRRERVAIAHVGTAALNAVSCPSESLCVAVDGAGRVITSIDPTAGPGAWATLARAAR